MAMHVSSLDLERHCRICCRPIHTGLGQVTVRPISPSDADLAQEFVTGPSGTSRYFRFFQASRCLSLAMLDRFTRIDHGHIALAGVADLDGTQTMVAEARYAVDGDGTSAEIALVVTDLWQRRGIATKMMTTLERIAGAAGITRLTGECLAVNARFVGLARSIRFQVRADPSDRNLLQIHKRIGEDSEIWSASARPFFEAPSRSLRLRRP
jgi:acetyltransferase